MIRPIARALRTLREREEGISLIELIVAMSISVIIIGAIGGIFAATLKASNADSVSESGARQSGTVMDALTQYVHAATSLPLASGTYAPSITVATPTDLRFYAYVNLSNGTVAQPLIVEFKRDPSTGMITEYQWAATSISSGYYTFPDPASPSVTPTATFLLGGPTASPTSDGTGLFTYLNGAGASFTPTSATLGNVRAVQVNLEIGSTVAGAAGNTHIQSTLYLFNVGYANATPSASAS